MNIFLLIISLLCVVANIPYALVGNTYSICSLCFCFCMFIINCFVIFRG